MLLISKVENIKLLLLKFSKQIFFDDSVFLLFQFVNVPHFSLSGQWNLEAQKLPRGMFLLILSLPTPHWTGANTNPSSNSNISKTIRLTIAFTRKFFERVFNKLSNDIQVDRLCTCGSLVTDV